MLYKLVPISWTVLILTNLQIPSIHSETTWVWSSSRTPQNNNNNGGSLNSNNFQSQNPSFGQTNLGSNSDRLNSGSQSLFPESPPRPSSSFNTNNKDNSALPDGTIRIVNGQGEARLIPGAANFVQNALQNIGGGGNSGGGGGGAGILGIGGNLIGSFFQNAPQFASSALGLLFGRPSKGSSGNSGGGSSSSSNSPSNGVSTLPASGSSFPILSPGGSSSSGSSRPSSSSSPSFNPGSGSGSGSGNCKCIPLNSCFLPSRPNGSCAGGNIQCCQTSSGTRAILPNDGFPASPNTRDQNNNGNGNGNVNRAERQQEVRLGLLENIVRGSGNVVDDTLDLILQRYYTEEDQQRLANRVAKSG